MYQKQARLFERGYMMNENENEAENEKQIIQIRHSRPRPRTQIYSILNVPQYNDGYIY